METTDTTLLSEEQAAKPSVGIKSEDINTIQKEEKEISNPEPEKVEQEEPEKVDKPAEKVAKVTVTEKEPETPTVPLSDFTRTKDVLYRLAEKVVGNEDALQSLAEEDPKLLERLKAEFPKKFKDVVIPKKSLSDEDIDERISKEVEKRLKESSKSVRLDEFRVRLGLTEIEFHDIKDDLEEKAERLIETEVSGSYSDALAQAYRLIDPAKAKKLVEKEVTKEMQERAKNSTSGAGKSQGESKKFSKAVLDNYKSMGFSSPEEMVKYQGKGDIDITDAIYSKVKRR